ncbi:colicin E5-related ribonuclease, partial [Escherichia coli]
RREVSALTDARKTLAYDFFRILRAPRNDPATVYGSPGKYVVVNDRTGEVTQISDKTDPGWVDDSRIQWGNKNDQ